MGVTGGDARAFVRSPLALLLILAVVSGLVLAVSGGARTALRASVTREDQGYVALSFADLDTVRECGNAAPMDVRFVVDNELGRDATVDYALSIVSRPDDATQPGRVARTLTGSIDLADGTSGTVSRPVVTPGKGDYDVLVQLLGDLATRDQSVSIHCAEDL